VIAGEFPYDGIGGRVNPLYNVYELISDLVKKSHGEFDVCRMKLIKKTKCATVAG
jgi:hypothetical protein